MNPQTHDNVETERPSPIALCPNNVPEILVSQHSWVVWNYELKDGAWTKVPKKPRGGNASTTNPSTWSTFDRVCLAYLGGDFDGIGIVLTGKPLDTGLYLIGLDFDHCFTNGVLDGDPCNAVKSLDTYAEISPSGEGLRLFLLHDNPIPARKNKVGGKSREVYSSGRYLTVTGQIYGEQAEVRHVA